MARWFESKFDKSGVGAVRRYVPVRKPGFLSTYTGKIIAVNVVAFIGLLILLSTYGGGIFSSLALVPSEIIAGRKIWTLLTSMFLHHPTFIFHIIFNMMTLFFMGIFVEKLIGRKRFLGLYLIGGLVANLFFILGAVLISKNPTIPGLGASGAIFALGGLLTVLTPRLPVLVFFVIPAPMWIAIGGLLIVFWILSVSAGLPVANTAHLGGLIVGLSYGFYLRRKYPEKTKSISRYFVK